MRTGKVREVREWGRGGGEIRKVRVSGDGEGPRDEERWGGSKRW